MLSTAPRALLTLLLVLAVITLACTEPTDDAPDDVAADTSTPDTAAPDADDDTDEPDDTPDIVEDGPVQGRFELVPGGATPFPFDLYTVADPTTATGRRLSLAAGQTDLVDRGLDSGILPVTELLETLNRLDGFGTFAHIALPVGGAVDEASLPTSTASDDRRGVWLVDVDPDSPDQGRGVPVDVRVVGDRRLTLVVLSPHRALRPATTYAAVVTREVLDAQGRALEPSPLLRAALGLEVSEDAPDNLAPATEAMAPLVDAVEPAVLESLVTATVFTTQSRLATTRAMYDAIVSGADTLTPTLEDVDLDGEPDVYAPDTLPNAQPNLPDMTGVGPVVRGRVQVPGFRAEHGDVELDAQGQAAVTETLDIGFVLALPTDASAQPFRIAVVQHGNGADKESALHLAGHLARAGVATLAIDLPDHGEEDTPGNALDFSRPAVMRGAFLQAEANQMALFEAAARMGDIDLVPADAPDGAPDLAVDEPLFYIGESLGGITGATSTAVSPRVGAAVYNVAGAGLRHMVGPLLGSVLGDDLVLVQLEILFQTFIDAADPVSMIELSRDKELPALVQIVVGDVLVSPAASETLALGLGIPRVCPCPDSAPALALLDEVQAPASPSGLSIYADSKHGVLLRDHDQFPASSDAMRAQIMEFLTPVLAGEDAVVVDPFAP